MSIGLRLLDEIPQTQPDVGFRKLPVDAFLRERICQMLRLRNCPAKPIGDWLEDAGCRELASGGMTTASAPRRDAIIPRSRRWGRDGIRRVGQVEAERPTPDIVDSQGAIDALPQVAILDRYKLAKPFPSPIVSTPFFQTESQATPHMFAGRDQRDSRWLAEGFEAADHGQ